MTLHLVCLSLLLVLGSSIGWAQISKPASKFVLREGREGFTKELSLTRNTDGPVILQFRSCSNFVIAGGRQFCCNLRVDKFKKENEGWTSEHVISRWDEDEARPQCKIEFKEFPNNAVRIKSFEKCSAYCSEGSGYKDIFDGQFVPLFEPSYTCKHSENYDDDEWMICRFPELALMDQKFNKKFKAGQIGKAAAKKLRIERKNCISENKGERVQVACILRAYEAK